MLHRRDVLKGAMGLAAASVAGGSWTGRAMAADKLTLQLSWLYNTASAGEIIADKKGFFAEKGLEVTINPGGPNANAVQDLLGDQCDVAVAYAPQIMYARNNGLPLKTMAAAFQRAPLAYYSLGASNIKSIKDWKGKKIGAAQSGLPQIQALLKLNGLAFEDIEFVQTGDVPALLQGQVDVIGTWETSIGQNRPILTHAGGYNVQLLWDNGLQFQSNYYTVKEDALRDKKDALVRFLEACDKGWSYAADNRAETVDVVLSMAPALDRQLETEALDLILDKYIFTENTVQNGFGDVSKERWNNTLATYAELGFVKAGITADDVFDASILEAAARTKR